MKYLINKKIIIIINNSVNLDEMHQNPSNKTVNSLGSSVVWRCLKISKENIATVQIFTVFLFQRLIVN